MRCQFRSKILWRCLTSLSNGCMSSERLSLKETVQLRIVLIIPFCISKTINIKSNRGYHCMVSVSKLISPLIKFDQAVIYIFYIILTFHFMFTAACLPRSVSTASDHCTIMLENASIYTKINNGYHKRLLLMSNTTHRVNSQHYLHKNVSRF